MFYILHVPGQVVFVSSAVLNTDVDINQIDFLPLVKRLKYKRIPQW
jgi:hypothetical protein